MALGCWPLSYSCEIPPVSRYHSEVSVINFHTKEVSVKVVYYGPGLCGKTTSLQTIYASLPPERRPQIVSLATEVDRTIFFDFLPVTAYRVRDFRVRLQLYTVPGQVFYNATRKLVLNGVDGIVFVADSQMPMKDSNLESLHNLQENLADLGLEPDQVPTILQFNKRDLKEIYSVEEMDKLYNPRRLPVFATVATSGDGLFEALRAVSQMVVNNLLRKGLGKQLGPPPGQAADSAKAAPSSTDSIGAAAEAASRAVEADPTTPSFPRSAMAGAPPPAASAHSSASMAGASASGAAGEAGMWPTRDKHLTEAIDRALAAGAYQEVVAGVDVFLRELAQDWAKQHGGVAADPMPSFLLTRGLSSTRYRGLVDTIDAVRANRPVDRAAAMNAVVVALESVW